MKWRDTLRILITLGCPALIVWLGQDALGNIEELYSGLCPATEGQKAVAMLKAVGDPAAYCAGIGDDTNILSGIVWLAAIAVCLGSVLWWQFSDAQDKKGSN